MEQQLIKLENDWNEYTVKRNAGGSERLLAEDWTVIDYDGSLRNKQRELADMKSGDQSFTSTVADELRVRVYGNTAVVTGRNTTKGKIKGVDISGQYRFTDTWVQMGGQWKCVASQAARVVQGK